MYLEDWKNIPQEVIAYIVCCTNGLVNPTYIKSQDGVLYTTQCIQLPYQEANLKTIQEFSEEYGSLLVIRPNV